MAPTPGEFRSPRLTARTVDNYVSRDMPTLVKTTRVFALYWNPGSADRQRELALAIQRNLDNPDVDEVVLIVERGAVLGEFAGHRKLRQVITDSERPTYREIFQIANERITSPYDMTILLNTDCWFEHGDLEKLKTMDTRQFVFAVTRWDVGPDLLPRPNFAPTFSGRDAWIFVGRIRPTKWLEFSPGQWNCDWYLDWQIQHAGYTVVNPCYDVRLWHLHEKPTAHAVTVRPCSSLCVGEIRELPPTRLEYLRIPETTRTGVIAYSLYGSGDIYTHGAMINAEMVRHLYPGFLARFYVDDTVPGHVVARLRELLAEVVVMPRGHRSEGMRWRFLALEDRSVDYVCIRDADSRLSCRDVELFDAWVADGSCDYHTVRDHPHHYRGIMGCYLSSRRPLRLPSFDGYGVNYGDDEAWLEQKVLPLMQHSLAVHDTFASGPHVPGARVLPSPTPSAHWNLFVGCKIWPDSGVNPTERRLCVIDDPFTAAFAPFSHGRWEEGTDKITVHDYANMYNTELGHLRNTTAALLEIGIASATSLRGWRAYLGAHASIVGVDVAPRRGLTSDEVMIEADSRDPAAVTKLTPYGPFDVIVDDGCHDPQHQIDTLRNLWPLLKDGGVYVIEDITSRKHMQDAIPIGIIYDTRRYKDRWDDVCMVLHKRSASPP